MRAFELWKKGLSWAEIGRALGETVFTIRRWRLEISNLIGEESLRRSQPDRPRDPETKRFARVVGRESDGGNGKEKRTEPSPNMIETTL